MGFIRDGGFGMYPTMLFGLLLLAMAVAYLFAPRRYLPGVVWLSVTTLGSGVLGFVTGLGTTFRAAASASLDDRTPLAFLGVAESANNLVLALCFVVLASLVCAGRSIRAAPASETGSAPGHAA